MKAKLFLFLILMNFFVIPSLYSQSDSSLQEEVENIRIMKDKQMTNPEYSILKPDQIENFKGLDYFPVSPDYLIQGNYVANASQIEITLNTTSGNKINLIQVGTVSFDFEGKYYSLQVFQNNNLSEFGENAKQLFIPFSDLTNGKETHEAGRYLPVNAASEDQIMVLDFNQAMNPFSAYTETNISVIPPIENSLLINIMAGERKYEDR